ncbi:MAG: UvrD-helicase domain-containing protein [Cyanobium sp. CZS 25K]|nr:UvrD-helicase domain-containing protein [Cyanobium sp. CZS25K]
MTPAGTGPAGPDSLDPNAVGLDDGVLLLEASAGTGKTFALAHLVLRLLAERRLGLRELLVVTYTNAAAAELRDRIGRRIQEALTGLKAPDDWRAPDPVLEQWLEGQPREAGARGTLQGLLLLALEELDAADITTIHGFCQRTLRRQAMEAARSPELALETDATELVRQVAHDYWQQQVLALPLHLVEGLAAGPGLDDLERLLLLLEGDPGLSLDPLPAGLSLTLPLVEQLETLWEEPWRRFRQAWAAEGQALEQAFRSAAGEWRAAGATSLSPYAPRPRTDHCGLVDAWLAGQPEGGSYAAVCAEKELGAYFHPDPFCRVARKVEGPEREIRLPCPGLLEAVAGLREGPAEAVLLHGCHWGRAELARRRARSGSLGFAQLLQGLDPGPDVTAPTPLLRAVGARYRAALIDEFQDTDPVQWRILRLAFADGAHLLVMVGDPKQAIYRFRGGDLDTYRRARLSAGRVLALQENRRSSPALIDSLNKLMSPAGLPRSRLPVPVVEARSQRCGPAGMAPVRLLWLGNGREAHGPLPSRSALEARLPDQVADAVRGLLEEAPGLVGRDGQQPRPLGAGDIALLVHNHRQAEEQRSALERRGIASRLVSKADVFASPAATALQRLLDALADPADPNRLRLLAASPLLGWSSRQIAATEAGEWSELAGQLQSLARDLPLHGPLGVLSRLVDGEGLARLSAGGRLLADLQQVAELLQERLHVERLSLVAAADWLRRLRLDQTRATGTIPESHQAHSDKVDEAVTVITVHRSKGLEFPVVICPYLWEAAGTPAAGGHRAGIRWQPPGSGAARLDLHLCPSWGQGWQALRQHRDAERAERERLAYVAVTRAQHLLLLAWAPAKGQQANPLFPWLFPDEPLPDPDDDGQLAGPGDGEWQARLLGEIGRRSLHLDLHQASGERPAQRTLPPPPAAVEALHCGPVPLRRLDTSWGRSSYTAWTRAAHDATVSVAALDEGRDTNDPSPADGAPATPAEDALWPEQGPLAGFARGAAAGDCLHRMLEQLDYRLPTDAEANRELVERELRRAGLGDGPPEALLEGLELVRLTPFGGALGSLRVGDLGPERRLNEMNFDLTLGHARAADLATAFAEHPGGAFGAAYAETVAALPVASRGFLTGSIDLIFTASGSDGEERWWVADWKSNWIGRRDGEGRPLACGPRHYGQEAMAALMAHSHYPLQAHLYLVALHRYLGWRLPAYAPERHLGGYAYVFLRGAPGAAGAEALPGAVPGMFVERPPLARVLALDGALGRHGEADNGEGGEP